jgi:hypothetical protein
MTTDDFVRGFKHQKDEMMQEYFADTSPASVVSVGTHIRSFMMG